MKRFTRLFTELDRTTRTSGKVAALEAYFGEAPPEDAAWAVHVLTGGRVKRAVQGRLLREWIAGEAGLPLWLLEETYHQVGDLAETLALVFPDRGAPTDAPLHRVMEESVLPLPELGEEEKRARMVETLSAMDTTQRLVYLKLITGAFRVGAGTRLVTRALASVAGVEPATMAHRLAGRWEPGPEAFRLLMDPDDTQDPSRPYPFFLAHPLQDPPDSLGPVDAWQAEWKWDGIRAQLIRRQGETLLWSRGEELVGPQFPEVVEGAAGLPDGTVLDGEVLGWREGVPLPFAELQRRLGRKRVGPKILREVPVAFLAYDLLEWEGEDVRDRALERRRALLESVVAEARSRRVEAVSALHLSPVVETSSWEAMAGLRETARERGVEGFMLKAREAPYGVGRTRGAWWKWKVDPLHLDAVLLYAQAGHGRRAGLHTDYTFGVWDGEELVPVAKAYSGLTDVEIRRLDRWVRRHTVEKFGPVRSVEREHVFELAFDGIQASSRHKSGVALRFPRISRWREDKRPGDADTLASVQALLEAYGNG